VLTVKCRTITTRINLCLPRIQGSVSNEFNINPRVAMMLSSRDLLYKYSNPNIAGFGHQFPKLSSSGPCSQEDTSVRRHHPDSLTPLPKGPNTCVAIVGTRRPPPPQLARGEPKLWTRIVLGAPIVTGIICPVIPF
jgi:hypothetical protein